MNFSVDLYLKIFEKISHNDFNYECYNLCKNARTAIHILKYDICPYRDNLGHSKCFKYLEKCEICNETWGFRCIPFNYRLKTLTKCYKCRKDICVRCIIHQRIEDVSIVYYCKECYNWRYSISKVDRKCYW